jgi:Transposase
MEQYSEAFVGIDTSKLTNAVSLAEAGRTGEVRYHGEIPTTAAATRKLVAKLASKYTKLTFCYEAGPTGYGLYWLIKSLGHECIVVAPSLIPTKPGDRIKTNRRDSENLAKLLRSGDLTAVWVPDPHQEAMRDLSRAREASINDLKRKRQQVSSLLLRLGLHYPGKTTSWRSHAAHGRDVRTATGSAVRRSRAGSSGLCLKNCWVLNVRRRRGRTGCWPRSKRRCRSGRSRPWSRHFRRCAASIWSRP